MRHLFYGISAIIFWGTSFLATKILIANHLSPMQISFVRFFLVWLAMLFIKPKNYKPIEKSDMKYFYIMGLLGITFLYYFENSGLKYTSIANTSLITSTIPFIIFDYKSFTQININIRMMLALFYLSLICTLLAYFLWNSAIKKIGIKTTSNLILFIPIISIIIGILFWNEPFSYNLVWSSLLILSGAYLTSQNRKNSNF